MVANARKESIRGCVGYELCGSVRPPLTVATTVVSSRTQHELEQQEGREGPGGGGATPSKVTEAEQKMKDREKALKMPKQAFPLVVLDESGVPLVEHCRKREKQFLFVYLRQYKCALASHVHLAVAGTHDASVWPLLF